MQIDISTIDPIAMYEIKVSTPFSFGLVRYMPNSKRTYRVSGETLLAIADKVQSFQLVTG